MIKNNKNIVITLLLAVVAMMLTVSCSEQDFPNPNAASEDSASIGFLGSGIESGMRIDLGIFYNEIAVLGREAYYLEPSDPRYTSELMTGPIDANGFLLTRPWGARYRIVKDCNVLLGRAADEPNAQFAAGARGFAKTTMAYQLLLNLILTDQNGIRVDVAGTPLGPILDKTAALNALGAMLDDGASDLASGGSSFKWPLSNGFASFNTPSGFREFNRGLRARVAAYQSNWAGVMSALGESFLDTSMPMEFGAYHSYTTGSGDLLNPIFEPTGSTFVKFLAHPTFVADAEPGDLRYSSKTFQRATPVSQAGLSSDVAVNISKNNVDNFPIIRNEELILLRAEANIQMGNLGAAQDDINVVRAAAGLADVTLTSEAQAMNQLLHERRYSLWVEGHRWADMRRYGRLGDLPLDRPGDAVVEMFPIPTNEFN